jgi:cystathionine beta-lyase/cystathionine gamma-synthase
MRDKDSWNFSTRAIHAWEQYSESGNDPAASPIHLSADYLFDGLEHYADVLNSRRPGYSYARFGTPAHSSLNQVIASIEEAESAFSFASGMAAIHTALASLIVPGDHIVADIGIYNTTFTLLESFMSRYCIRTTFTAPEADSINKALEPHTRLVLIDSITTPTFRVADVEGIATVCQAREVPLIIDNTIATPFLLRPLKWPGVKLVLNSTSKYIGGHSDLIGGSAAGSIDLISKIADLAKQLGTIADPFDAWLVLRGVQTLAMRMTCQCASAMALADALTEHPEVKAVGYAGLPHHPDHERATRLFDGAGFGAMLSMALTGGYDAAVKFCGALRIARVGSGFGGLRTEVRHPATTSHRMLTEEERLRRGIGPDLVRVAVGAEDTSDLIADFIQALGQLRG